jgi:exodeoxyribonuclease VII large subunit
MRIQRTQISGLAQRLAALNPRSVIARGYAVVSQPDGTIVRSVAQAHPGDHLNIHVSDGKFAAEVLNDPKQ